MLLSFGFLIPILEVLGFRDPMQEFLAGCFDLNGFWICSAHNGFVIVIVLRWNETRLGKAQRLLDH